MPGRRSGVKDQQAVTAQLFKGNEYGFWLATDTGGAVITVHIYDLTASLPKRVLAEGSLRRSQDHTHQATGAYYAIVTVEKSPQERSNWALVYGYR